VELQGTAEGTPFADADLGRMLELARAGVLRLTAAQKEALGAEGAR
jgi:ribonuclease PH